MKPTSMLRIGAAACAVTLSVSASQAADIFWNAGGTGSYTTPGNWQGGALPTDADLAIIDSGNATLDNAGESALQLRVGSSAGETATFTMINGASFQTAEAGGGDLLIGTGGTGTATITDSTFTVGRWLKVGNAGGMGTLILNGTTQLELDQRPLQDPPLEEDEVWIGGDGAGSDGTLSMADSARLTAYSNIYIGVNDGTATGALDMSGTSEIRAHGGNHFLIGTGGATGTATLSGDARIEKVNMIGGSTGQFAVGNSAGSVGTLTMEENAVIDTAGEFAVGAFGGQGFVTLSGNARIESVGNFLIGGSGSNGGSGTVLIEGNAAVSSNGEVIVGNTGESTGTLTLNGGSITATAIRKGAGAATVVLDGGTVHATADGDFFPNFATEDIDLQAGGLKFDTGGHAVLITQGLAGAGGLVKQGSGTLILTGTNTFMGFSAVEAGVLEIAAGGSLDGVPQLHIAANAGVIVSETISLNEDIVLTLVDDATLTLNFDGKATIAALWINGQAVTPDEYTLAELNALAGDAIFAGNINASLDVTSVVPEPGTVALLAGGLVFAAWRLRRRRL